MTWRWGRCDRMGTIYEGSETSETPLPKYVEAVSFACVIEHGV